LTIDKLNDATNEYLSDEYRQAAVGKTLKYSESDVEKVSERQTGLNFDLQQSRKQKSDRNYSNQINAHRRIRASLARVENNILTHIVSGLRIVSIPPKGAKSFHHEPAEKFFIET
jgi:hypothetical protein